MQIKIKGDNMVKIKDKDEIRAVFHLSITPKEKLRIKEIAQTSNMSMSEFMRQAIFDKITRIENPDIKSTSTKDDTLILEYLKKHDSRLSKMENILRERVSNGKVIKSSLEEIKSRVNHARLDFEREVVIKALKRNVSLRPKELSEQTNIDKNDIYEIISDDSIFMIEVTTGKVKLVE